MAKTEPLSINYSGRSIARNTLYNLLGYGIPLVFALVLIPPLIKGLGEERFGILNLAWMVIGYFSFFDFGIGRALTKIVAEKIGLSQTEKISSMFWTSFFLMLILSLIGSLIFIIITPFLVYNFFNISESLQLETQNTFYVLAISVPIVITTAGIRGVLEAYQKFGILNILRIILGVFTFLGPIICLLFTNSLFWIVLFLTSIRFVVWVLHFFVCFKFNPELKTKINFELILIRPILKLSGWMTVSNIIAPLIAYLDRFLIGAIISASAITFYATPYEVVTKLLLISGALIGVLFPAFSATYFNNKDESIKLFRRGIKFIIIILFPVVLLIVTFSYEGLNIWLGEKFANNSNMILRLLAIGVFFNSIAYLPVTLFQGIGKPNIPAILNLFELPFYIGAMWFAIKKWGINGAALVWLLRIIIDTVVLFFLTKKIIPFHFTAKIKVLSLLVISFALFIPFFIYDLFLKSIFVLVTLLLFVIILWRYMIQQEEKIFLISKLKTLGIVRNH